MEFRANHVSASVAGDYYQALFEVSEEWTDPASPYLLLQRQFEMPDGGRCRIETHDENFIGEFRLRRIEFSPERLRIEFARATENVVQVTFHLDSSEYQEVLEVLQIISGNRVASPRSDAAR